MNSCVLMAAPSCFTTEMREDLERREQAERASNIRRIEQILLQNKELNEAIIGPGYAGIGRCTPLAYTCYVGRYDLAATLLEKGANPNLVYTSFYASKAPLISACRHGHFDIVKLLIQYGANVNPNISSYSSPLNTSFFFGHINISVLLIHSGSLFNPNTLPNSLHLIKDEEKRLIVRQAYYDYNWARRKNMMLFLSGLKLFDNVYTRTEAEIMQAYNLPISVVKVLGDKNLAREVLSFL